MKAWAKGEFSRQRILNCWNSLGYRSKNISNERSACSSMCGSIKVDVNFQAPRKVWVGKAETHGCSVGSFMMAECSKTNFYLIAS